MTKKVFMFVMVCVSMVCACQKIDEPGALVPKTVNQTTGIPSITVNGRMLHAEAFGHPDSTIIVCIHGGPGADYRYMLPAKAIADSGYRVVFYDQIGSGLSQRFDESFYDNKNLNDIYYNELKGVIDYYKTHNNQKVILLGHSWGAILATAYAGKFPNEIDGLALMEPGGLKWDDIVTYISTSQSVPLWHEMVSDIFYQDQFISTHKDNHEILDYKMTLLASHGNTKTKETLTGKDGFWRFGSVINFISFNYGQKYKPDMSAGIENYTRPVLFIHGGNGLVYTDEWAKKISSVYVNKEIYKINEAGHSAMFDAAIWKNTTLPKLINYFKTL